MLKQTQLRQAVAAALLTLSGTQVALAEAELEREGQMGVNDSILTAQRLTFGACQPAEEYPAGKLCAVVDGNLGVIAPAATPIPDLDFYSFEAQAGDVLAIDIDGGMKPSVDPLKVRSVDTYLAVFGPLPDVRKLRENTRTDPTVPRDRGSEDVRDALIDKFAVRVSGTYVVGVSSDPRAFVDGGSTTNSTVTGRVAPFPNGAYRLIVSGVTPSILQVNIEIKPGSGVEAPLNPKARGNVPVALLSFAGNDRAPAFDALKVDLSSLTFGSTGDEKSYLRCAKEGLDVNADGLLDLVCHFDNVAARWQADDLEGILKGSTLDGKRFEGRAPLRVVPKVQD